MLLIESDKRDQEWAMPLASGKLPFYVPANVFIMGLMNTADRSLAVVDYALRRRFAFVDLAPNLEAPKFRQQLEATGVSSQRVSLLIERVGELNDEIVGDVVNLGPGFAIGHSFFCSGPMADEVDRLWYERIMRTEIVPLLREYWFDQPSKVTQWGEAASGALMTEHAFPIPIENIYYLFCYAWDRFEEAKAIPLGGTSSPDLPNLLAKVLLSGTRTLLRQGLDRGYEPLTEQIATVRGHIELGETLRLRARRTHRLECSFDELSYDVLHNQVIKASLRRLAKAQTLDREVARELYS